MTAARSVASPPGDDGLAPSLTIANDADMAAIVAYLRSLKPLPFGGAPAAKP